LKLTKDKTAKIDQQTKETLQTSNKQKENNKKSDGIGTHSPQRQSWGSPSDNKPNPAITN
jgi:hypothetical protein